MEKYYMINDGDCGIRCKLYSAAAPVHKVLLFGHGFGGHKDNKAAEAFAGRVLQTDPGMATVTFNWPCHGDDGHTVLRLEDCERYLQMLLADIDERFGSPGLYAYANSFGAYLFLKYISEHGDPFRKTALRSPAVSMYEVITSAIMDGEDGERIKSGGSALVGFDRKVEIDGVFLESLRKEDIVRRDYRAYADSILILHGTDDEIVPYETVRAFAEKNAIPFVPISGGDHRLLGRGQMAFAVDKMLEHFELQ